MACRESVANDFHGIKGALCSWYVTPCDCETGNEELPKICTTEPVATETLAKIVIRGLEQTPALLHEEALFAAAVILSETYPCTE